MIRQGVQVQAGLHPFILADRALQCSRTLQPGLGHAISGLEIVQGVAAENGRVPFKVRRPACLIPKPQ